MKRLNVWQSSFTAPGIDSLWVDGTDLKVYTPTGWQSIGKEPKVDLPTEATVETSGLVKKMQTEAQLDKSVKISEVIDKVNSIIVKLQAAGIME